MGAGRPKAKKEIPDAVLAREIAPLLGVGMTRLPQLAKEGIIPKSVKGRYPVRETIVGYWKWKATSVERQNQSTSADKLRERRDEEIALRIAREKRELIPLSDALADHETITGQFLATISGLPARITRDPRERQRIEKICDEDRLRLTDLFAKQGRALQSGIPIGEADDEDDA